MWFNIITVHNLIFLSTILILCNVPTVCTYYSCWYPFFYRVKQNYADKIKGVLKLNIRNRKRPITVIFKMVAISWFFFRKSWTYISRSLHKKFQSSDEYKKVMTKSSTLRSSWYLEKSRNGRRLKNEVFLTFILSVIWTFSIASIE